MDVEKFEDIKIVPFSEFMSDFWIKYISKNGVSEKTGFVNQYGAVDVGKIRKMYDVSQPYMMAYYIIHGDIGLKSTPSYWSFDRSEPIFKQALEEGKTWQEVTGFDGYKKGNLY